MRYKNQRLTTGRLRGSIDNLNKGGFSNLGYNIPDSSVEAEAVEISGGGQKICPLSRRAYFFLTLAISTLLFGYLHTHAFAILFYSSE